MDGISFCMAGETCQACLVLLDGRSAISHSLSALAHDGLATRFQRSMWLADLGSWKVTERSKRDPRIWQKLR